MEEQISKTRESYDIFQRENNLQITRLREANREQRAIDHLTVSDSKPRRERLNR